MNNIVLDKNTVDFMVAVSVIRVKVYNTDNGFVDCHALQAVMKLCEHVLSCSSLAY